MDLETSVIKSKEKAKKAVENCDKPGDPGTHIWCDVDGRKVPKKLKEGINSVKVKDGKLHIKNIIKGTDIQNHNKKRVMYEVFCQEMKRNGYDLGHSIQSHSR